MSVRPTGAFFLLPDCSFQLSDSLAGLKKEEGLELQLQRKNPRVPYLYTFDLILSHLNDGEYGYIYILNQKYNTSTPSLHLVR